MEILTVLLAIIVIILFIRNIVLKFQRDVSRQKEYDLKKKIKKIEEENEKLVKNEKDYKEKHEVISELALYTEHVAGIFIKKLAEEIDARKGEGTARERLEKVTEYWTKKSFKTYKVEYDGVKRVLLKKAPKRPEPRPTTSSFNWLSNRTSGGSSSSLSSSSSNSSRSSYSSPSYSSSSSDSYSSYDSSSYSSSSYDSGSSYGGSDGGGSCD